MKKLLKVLLFTSLGGCATSSSTEVNCRLWQHMPATHQRKFIHQGQFTDALAEQAPLASSDRNAIYSVCDWASPDMKLGRYYLWP